MDPALAFTPVRSLLSPFFTFRTIAWTFFLFLLHGVSGQTFRVSNPTGLSRKAGEVLISRESLRNMMELPANEIPVLYANDKVIPSQTDDITGDGQWDELAFQLDVERNSSVQVKVKWVPAAKAPVFIPRARCLLGVKNPGETQFQPVEIEMIPEDWHSRKKPERYLCEGPVWESEKIAFRHFFDKRNFTSPLVKKTQGFLTDSLNLPRKEYHFIEALLPDSGLGAGGFAVSGSGKWNLPSKAGSLQFRLLANGPVRAVFDLLYEEWPVEDNLLNVRRRVSIWAGNSSYKTALSISGFRGEMETAIGMSVPAETGRVQELPAGGNFSAFFRRNVLAKEKEHTLSLGMLLPTSEKSMISVSGSENADLPAGTCFRKYRLKSGQQVEFLVFAAGEKKDDLPGNSPEFRNLMQYELDCLLNPLTISR